MLIGDSSGRILASLPSLIARIAPFAFERVLPLLEKLVVIVLFLRHSAYRHEVPRIRPQKSGPFQHFLEGHSGLLRTVHAARVCLVSPGEILRIRKIAESVVERVTDSVPQNSVCTVT